MKILYSTIIIFFIIVSFKVQAQTNDNKIIMPDSYNLKLSYSDIDYVQVTPPSKELITEEDIRDEKEGTMYKIGRLLPVDLTTENSGTWHELEDGSRIWRLRISSEDAKASAIHFDYFKLEKNARLFVYNIDYKVVLGPFTSDDNPHGWEYSIGVLYGNDIIIEYILPAQTFPQKSINRNSESKPDFKISAYSYIYRGEYLFFDDSKATGYGTSGECQVNINCTEGNNWRNQQKGVARVYAVEGWAVGYCTGSLVNNTANDLKPYFLTANHCGENSTIANFRQWRFDFNYESPGCIDSAEPSRKSFIGCSKRSAGTLSGGSDFLLVELSATKEQLKNANVIYNGWRKNDITSTSGVSIHHPSGDIKKISTYTGNLSSATYYGDGETGATNAHWRVRWSSTANGYGVTEGGSSGSPIFDNNGYIIGTLSGGSSFCDYTNGSDLYGKMSYHWTSNGLSDDSQLQPWLDPNNTGAISCELLDPNNSSFVDRNELENNIKIYPNPNNGLFNITASKAGYVIKIYDILGKEIKAVTSTSDETIVDISEYGSGIYVVHINTGKEKIIKRISVN